MLVKRVISGIVGILLLFALIMSGRIPFFIFSALLVILATNEYYNLLGNKLEYNKYFLIILSLLFFVSMNSNLYTGPVLFLIFIFLFVYHIYNYSYENILYSIALSLLGIIYIGGGLSFFVRLQELQTADMFATGFLWITLLGTWAVDTGAYFSGIHSGKTKLSPRISPNKTLEGAIGGISLSIGVTLVFVMINGFLTPAMLFYALLLGPIAVLGDLFESAVKRDLTIKDSGELIPGHGGILDRFDSLLFTLPFSYYYFLILFF